MCEWGFYRVVVRCTVLMVCAWHDVWCDWLMLIKVWTTFVLCELFMGIWPLFHLVFCLRLIVSTI